MKCKISMFRITHLYTGVTHVDDQQSSNASTYGHGAENIYIGKPALNDIYSGLCQFLKYLKRPSVSIVFCGAACLCG